MSNLNFTRDVNISKCQNLSIFTKATRYTCWWWPLDEMEDLPVEVVVFNLLVVLEDPAAIDEPLQVSLNVHLRGNLLLQVFNGALVVHVFYGVIGRVQGLDRHLDGGHDLNVSNVFGKLLTFSNRVDSLFLHSFQQLPQIRNR